MGGPCPLQVAAEPSVQWGALGYKDLGARESRALALRRPPLLGAPSSWLSKSLREQPGPGGRPGTSGDGSLPWGRKGGRFGTKMTSSPRFSLKRAPRHALLTILYLFFQRTQN